MSLLDQAIWWHVYPLGACGAPLHEAGDANQVCHRLRSLESWLDYAVDLGCSGLLLGPIFSSSTHGYDTLDHFRIDPRLGDDEDFEHLIAEAKRRGLSVMLDGVFNHVGVHHPAVSDAVHHGGGLVRVRDGRPEPWEGHTDLALLNHESPDALNLVVEVMLHWLRRGISGWRLDVAYAVPGWFWQQAIGRVREEFPEAVFLGEVIHGDYPQIMATGSLNSVTQYELWKSAWSFLADKNCWELAWTLDRHSEMSQAANQHGGLLQTFIGNHDVDRIASKVGDAGAVVALGVLLTVPGMPSIYYGDEQGFRGTKGSGVGADDPMRPALPASPSELSEHGWWLYRLHQYLIGLRRRNPWLSRAKIDIVHKENTSLRYRVSDGDQSLDVLVWLEPSPRIQILSHDRQVFGWPS